MKKINNHLVTVLCLFYLLAGWGSSTHVYANKADETEIGYHIYAILPENQKNSDSSFFDLKMTPGQKQTIEVALANTSTEDQTFSIEINPAYTNDQGFIDYSEKKETQEKKSELTIERIATYEKKITVPKQQTKNIPITLTMPEETYNGELLAGIKVSKVEKQTNQVGIANTYSYLLGLRLTENDQKVQRKIGVQKIEPTIAFGKASVAIDLINPVREAYGHLTYHVEVQNMATGKKIKEKTYTDLQLAPVSTYHFSIDWDDEQLVAGQYKLALTIEDKKDNQWTFHREFSISADAAKQINTVVVAESTSSYLAVLLGAGVLILVTLMIVCIKKWKNKIRKRRKL